MEWKQLRDAVSVSGTKDVSGTIMQGSPHKNKGEL